MEMGMAVMNRLSMIAMLHDPGLGSALRDRFERVNEDYQAKRKELLDAGRRTSRIKL
jgi:hypothetical protein